MTLSSRSALGAGWTPGALPAREHVSILYLTNLSEEVLKATWQDALGLERGATLDSESLA